MKKIAFLFSGRGTLLRPIAESLKDVSCTASIVLVITNNHLNADNVFIPEGSSFYCLDHKRYAHRLEHEEAIIKLLRAYQIDLIVLGGYRRIFSEKFVEEFGYKTINTHPSLLPAFIGDKAQQKAIERGVRITGTTVHFINNEVDQGPIIMQAAVQLRPSYSANELKDIIVNLDKRVLSRAVKLFLEGKLKIEGHRVFIPSEYEDELFLE